MTTDNELTETLLRELRTIMAGKNAPEGSVDIGADYRMLQGGRVYRMRKVTELMSDNDILSEIPANVLLSTLRGLKERQLRHTEKRIERLQDRAERTRKVIELLRED